MSSAAGVYRTGKDLKEALEQLTKIAELALSSKAQGSRRFNYSLSEKFELKNMLSVARAVLKSALGREESRGAHYRLDFPEADDADWLKHSLLSKENGRVKLDYKNVETEDEK
jgi:succinate dehydrogenase / fumarate reductase flavoprotein subunit